jgi:hypothetical protein
VSEVQILSPRPISSLFLTIAYAAIADPTEGNSVADTGLFCPFPKLVLSKAFRDKAASWDGVGKKECRLSFLCCVRAMSGYILFMILSLDDARIGASQAGSQPGETCTNRIHGSIPPRTSPV